MAYQQPRRGSGRKQNSVAFAVSIFLHLLVIGIISFEFNLNEREPDHSFEVALMEVDEDTLEWQPRKVFFQT